MAAVMPFASRALDPTAAEICQLAQAHVLEHLVHGTALPRLRVASEGHHGLTLLEALSRVDLEVGEISESLAEYPKTHTFLSDLEIAGAGSGEEDEGGDGDNSEGGEEEEEQDEEGSEGDDEQEGSGQEGSGSGQEGSGQEGERQEG
jgi:hypothetical protein